MEIIPNSNPIAQLCSVCRIPCTSSCGSCKKVSYCSKAHQKEDWKSHKSDCFPATIKSNEEFGRHFVATRNILEGELIFKEKPLVSGPSGKDGLFPVCLSCYRIPHPPTFAYTCSKCKWPVCNILCENDPIHAQNECPIFSKNQVVPFTPEEIHLYEKILVLRALLLKGKGKKEQQIWDKIMDLQSHAQARRETLKGSLLTSSAIRFIKDSCNQGQFSSAEIDHVVGALGTNAFCSEDSPSCSQVFRSASYLFYNGSIPAHDCTPNGNWIIQGDSEYQLRASVNIMAGDVITQLYTQPFGGTLERRKHLRETKYFSCHCPRCKDPTELGTFFSAILCSTCHGQNFFLPKNPTQSDSPWICTGECKGSKSCQEIEKSIAAISQDIEDSPDGNDLESIKVLEMKLKKYRSKVLHENHYLIYQLEHDIMQRISFILTINSTSNKLRKEECQGLAERLVELSRKSLVLVNVLCKGQTRHKGRLLYFLQQGLQYRILRSLNTKTKGSKKSNANNPTPEELKAQIEELIEIRKQAGMIFQNEPETREEFHLLKFLREYSKDMQTILKFYGSKQ